MIGWGALRVWGWLLEYIKVGTVMGSHPPHEVEHSG